MSSSRTDDAAPEDVRIDCGRIALRSWRRADLASLVRHADNRKIWLNLRDAFPHPYTEEAGGRWLDLATADERRRDVLAIDLGGEAVGGVGVHPFADVYRRTAEIGYWLAEPWWGQGLATEAVAALVAHALAEHPELVRLQAGVFSSNPASGRVLQKCGFDLECTHRKAVVKDGALLDELIYARFVDGRPRGGA